ncbi:MAG: glutamate--tRNA ligase [Candidatus Paceibacterota bacterium]
MVNKTKNMKTRFAPSPTGNLHIGSARTALFNFLAATHYGGEMYLRIEDTDIQRSREEYEKDILEGLAWLGLKYSGEIIYQSRRGDIYEKHVQGLLQSGSAYESKEEKDGEESMVIRFKNPNIKVSFTDLVRGEIEMDTADLGDFIIAKSVRDPLYHLAVVVDDHEMGITHIIRGEDHISNTPRQILIQDALGALRPKYAHLPLVLGEDRSKLSKRHGATSVGDFKAEGYLPEALLNYMAFLGWAPAEEIRQQKEDVFSLSELTKYFSFEHIGKGGAIFDYQKLHWLNRRHIKNLTDSEWLTQATTFFPHALSALPNFKEKVLRARRILTEHIDTFQDIEKLHKDDALSYFFIEPHYETKKLLWKGETDKERTQERVLRVASLLTELDEKFFSKEKIKEAVWEYAEKEGRGGVLWPMRFALSGKEHSPDPFTLSEFFGKKETISRLRSAAKKLEVYEK